MESQCDFYSFINSPDIVSGIFIEINHQIVHTRLSCLVQKSERECSVAKKKHN